MSYRILAIETSCDETGISIIEGSGNPSRGGVKIKTLADSLISQIDIHQPYGGVFPMLAKREHGKNLVPMLAGVLKKAKLVEKKSGGELKSKKEIEKIFQREPELLSAFLDFLPTIETPKIDAVSVTYGPGLEPALWVGINFAKALSLVWKKPLIPINHMEGHIASALLKKSKLEKVKFPALVLLISGGHTELVLIEKWFDYKIIGETRDDAVGEAFDKVARILELPYPGGPEISARAEMWRKSKKSSSGSYTLPRPMLHSKDYDFSFAGLKTAVLYMVKKIGKLKDAVRDEICFEFEEAATAVLVEKTLRAAREYKIKMLLLGGGVSANKRIREAFKKRLKQELPKTAFFIPEKSLTGDNALMIATAAYLRASTKKLQKIKNLSARGNLTLGGK